MVRINVPLKYNNKKIVRFLKDNFENLSLNTIYKAIRTKKIKVNGNKISENITLKTGDQVDIYIKNDILYGLSNKIPTEIQIVYEDNNLLLVNKKPGIPVHPDKDPYEPTLIDMVTQYLQKKGEYMPGNPTSFPPALCHRLDRNTGGIVIIAKNPEARKVILSKIKKREIKKFYQCIVIGCPQLREAELRHYLIKDKFKSRVYISDKNQPGAVEIITRYKVLSPGKEMSKLEIELVTGKTHQIRAHLAYIGHPIVGDGKYGINKFNKKVGAKHQALWAYKIIFDFKNGGPLNYLKGKVFEIQNIDFQIRFLEEKG